MKGLRIHLRHKHLYYLLMNWVCGTRREELSRMTSTELFSSWVMREVTLERTTCEREDNEFRLTGNEFEDLRSKRKCYLSS